MIIEDFDRLSNLIDHWIKLDQRLFVLGPVEPGQRLFIRKPTIADVLVAQSDRLRIPNPGGKHDVANCIYPWSILALVRNAKGK